MEERGKVWVADMPLEKWQPNIQKINYCTWAWVMCSRAKTYTGFSGTKSTERAQELPRLISLPYCKALLTHQRLETILRLFYLSLQHFVWPFWPFIPSSRKDVPRSGQCHLPQLCLWLLSRRPKGTESSGPCPAEIAAHCWPKEEVIGFRML